MQPKVLLSFPYHELIERDQTGISALMRDYKLRAIRYPTHLQSFGFVSTLDIKTNHEYDLSCLHSTARRQTKQGMKNCIVREIDFDYLTDKGLSLKRDTAEPQRRESQCADPDYRRRYCGAG